MSKHPTRAELLGLNKAKVVKEKKAREKSQNEKISSLGKKMEQTLKRLNRAKDAYHKEGKRLEEVMKELQAICQHKKIKTEMLSPGDMDFESPFYEIRVCKACNKEVSRKSVGR
jgi:phosphatidate phosphatase PAH1